MKFPMNRDAMERIWKKYRLILMAILGGLFLMLLPTKQSTDIQEAQQDRETFSLESTEQRMEEILSRIEGTGKLQLMLTLKSGPHLYLAEDAEESAGDGEMQLQRETVKLHRGSGYEDVVVTQQVYPIYQGAVVVCQGADKASVRLAVTEAVSALTGLSSDRITVVKWNS